MPKIYIIQEIVAETIRRFPLTVHEVEQLKAELLYKTNRELENMLEIMQEQDELETPVLSTKKL